MKLEKARKNFKKHTKGLEKDKERRQEQRSALNMVMLKEGEQARQLDEKLVSGAKEKCSSLDMVMLKEGKQARVLNEDKELGSGTREHQGSDRTLWDKYVTLEPCGQVRTT